MYCFSRTLKEIVERWVIFARIYKIVGAYTAINLKWFMRYWLFKEIHIIVESKKCVTEQ